MPPPHFKKGDEPEGVWELEFRRFDRAACPPPAPYLPISPTGPVPPPCLASLPAPPTPSCPTPTQVAEEDCCGEGEESNATLMCSNKRSTGRRVVRDGKEEWLEAN